MKNTTITIKNELPELLEAICTHAECPDWLADGIWDLVNNQDHTVIWSADYWRCQLESIIQPKAAQEILEEDAPEYADESPEQTPLTVIRGGVQ